MTKKIGIFAFCGAVLALVLWLFCGPDVAAEAVYPVENGVNWFSRIVVRRFKAAFASGSALVENDRLRAEVASLKMTCSDADRIAAENVRLRGLLGLDASSSSARFGTNAWICAPIISRGAASGNPCILRLGAGLRAGVKTGAVVAVPEGLVGRIGNVTPNTSELRLLTDPSMRIACDVALGGPAGGFAHGILSGRGLTPVAATETSLLYIVPPLSRPERGAAARPAAPCENHHQRPGGRVPPRAARRLPQERSARGRDKPRTGGRRGAGRRLPLP